LPAAIERGEVTSTRDGWQLSNLDNKIPNAEVDRWRKLAAIPDEERFGLVQCAVRFSVVVERKNRSYWLRLPRLLRSKNAYRQIPKYCDLAQLVATRDAFCYPEKPWRSGVFQQ